MAQGEGGGRPKIELTDEQIVQVESLAAYLTSEEIADYLGISRRVFYDIMEREPEVYARYTRGRARVKARIANRLIAKADTGDFQSMRFYLATQGGWSEQSRVDHTSSDGSMSRKYTDEELDKELKARGIPTKILDE